MIELKRWWASRETRTGRTPAKPVQAHEPQTADAKIATGPEKLTWAGIKVSLIELKSCEFLRKLARAGIKVSLIELKSCELLQKLARPEFKWAEFGRAL